MILTFMFPVLYSPNEPVYLTFLPPGSGSETLLNFAYLGSLDPEPNLYRYGVKGWI